MNPHLRYTFAYRFAIAEVAIFCAVDARLNVRNRPLVLQIGKPGIKRWSGLDLNHAFECIL